MRLPPKNSANSAISTSLPNSGAVSKDSIQELVAASFNILEDNINDIIAFEETAEMKQYDFDRARKMYASPSERYIMTSPPAKSKAIINKLSPVQTAKKRFSLNSKSSKASGGATPKKRMSLNSDSSWMNARNDVQEGTNDEADQNIKPSCIRRSSFHSVSSHQSSNQSNGDKAKPGPSSEASKKPSERALYELQELSKKFESDMKVDELRHELERASKTYEIFGNKAPFGIDTTDQSETNNVSRRGSSVKRISFQKDLSTSLNEEDALGAVKEVLTFFQSSLQEYTQQQLEELEMSEGGTEDTSKTDQHLAKFIDTKMPSQRRLSDVTLDITISNEKGKRPSDVIIVEDAKEKMTEEDKKMQKKIEESKEERMRKAKEFLYADAGRSSIQQESKNITPTASGGDNMKEKSNLGASLSRLFKVIKAWIQRQVEAFVASFTPKEKMIVKQMG